MSRNAVSKSSAILGGTTVFQGTRVPVETLIDYLEKGDSIDIFLEDFPTVKRQQVLRFLETVKENLFRQITVK